VSGDEIADRIRVEELRSQGVDIGLEFGAWNATVSQGDGERTLARHSLPKLLDDVDEILAGGDPRAGPPG
jgi:hypothetical protein